MTPTSAPSSAASTSPTLTVEGLRKTYGNLVAVDDVSFQVHPGEFVGFIGPNGAGKSTTMRAIMGLAVPTAGRIALGGVDVTTDPVAARGVVGYVPQDIEVYRYLTGEELLRFVAAVRGVPAEEVDERVRTLLALCDLTEARGRLIREYSGGMARKVAMAAALVAKPKLLLMDEAFVGLDPESTYRLRRHLEAYAREGGAVVLSSHILDMLERICTRVIVLHRGRVVADLDRAGLDAALQDPQHDDLTSLYLHLTGQGEFLA